MSDPNKVDAPSPRAPTQPPAAESPELSGAENSAREDVNAAKGKLEEGVAVRPEIPAGATIKDVYDKCKELYTEDQKAKAWTDVAKTVETYSDKMIERWIKEIDTYLVFAGLFSAILTAFNVPAYALLNPTPPDPSISLLQQISNKLDSFSINHPFINSTQPSSTNSPSAGTVPPILSWAVWLNGLWFSGLVLSLTAASIGLMAKQWLNEYSSGVIETSRHAARVRQYRLENLKAWHVAGIVNTIPILLQLSLVCFLAGLLILLWNLHSTVAAIVSTLVGLLAIFTIAVTLLPLWKPRCAWLSPQTRALYHIWQPKRFTYWVCTTLATTFWRAAGYFRRRTVGYESPSTNSRLRYFKNWKEPKQTWQGRERSCIDTLKGPLDVTTLCEAYGITLHPHTLSAVTVCSMDFDAKDVIDCFRLLHKSAQKHFGPDAKDHPRIWGQQQMLWLHVVLCMESEPLMNKPPLLDPNEAAALHVYFESGSWSSSTQAADAEWAASTLNAFADRSQGAKTDTGSSTESIGDQGQFQKQREELLVNAIDRKEPLTNVVLRVISGKYRHVRLEQERLTKAPSGNAKVIDTSYLRAIYEFLECVDHASKLPRSPVNSDLETVRAYTRDVLTNLTRTLLELIKNVYTRTLKLPYLDGVMRKLRDFDDDRVEECIPDELVQEILTLVEMIRTKSPQYVDCGSSDSAAAIQQCARTFQANIARVKNKLAATWAYDQVCLLRKQRQQPSSSNILNHYLRSVQYLLVCAEHVSMSSAPSASAADPNTVRAHMRIVLTELTHTLSMLFATKEGQTLRRTTMKSTFLDDVMRKLRDLDDTRVEEYIPDELVPAISDLAEKLMAVDHYDEDRWVGSIKHCAHRLRENIARVKCQPAVTWAYDQVCLQQEILYQVSSLSEDWATHMNHYLQDLHYYLVCADHASKSPALSVDDLETVRTHTRIVITNLTLTLGALFSAKDSEGQAIQARIKSTYLDDVVRKLHDLDDTRMEECIPDELVPAILDLAENIMIADHYDEDLWVGTIRHCVGIFQDNIARVKCLPAATWAYDQVCLRRKLLQQPSSSNNLKDRAAYMDAYLQSVHYYLVCAEHASSTSSAPSTGPNLQTVRTHTQAVLTELTHTLGMLFASKEGQALLTAMKSTYLDDVMRRLRDLDDTRVEECIPDELVPAISGLVEKLMTVDRYDEDLWVETIKQSAHRLQANIARVKNKLATTRSSAAGDALPQSSSRQ